MALFDLLKRNRWISFGAASVLAFALTGCGGGDDSTDTSGGTTPPPSSGNTVKVSVPPPTGTPIDAAALTPAEFAALAPKGAVTSVSIASPPVVTFQLTDAGNRGIKGLGFTSQSATAAFPGLTNMAFAMAKLVPGSNGAPSKWVSYIVTSSPSTTAGAAPTRPTTDNIGTLVDNGDGTYKYTFYRDITKVKDIVAAASLAAPNVAADLGDLSYDATKLHRLVIQVSGPARGTGSNTATGANSGVTAATISSPANIVLDWYPATGKVVTATEADQRELVSIDNCNECHGKLAFHRDSARVDTKFCVVCHTEQRKFGQVNVASTANKFPALKETATVNSVTGITSFTYSPETRVADGEVSGNFTTLVHKIHMGKDLVKENYNYADVAFNNKGYSMLGGGQKMCSKCHDNTKAAQADNWKAKPTRLACGACHDGIDWKTGAGTTLADKAAGLGKASGHAGKQQPDDATCVLCHRAELIAENHQTENLTKHNPVVPAGLKNISYEIKSAAVDGTNKATVVFRVLVDKVPAKFKAPAAAMAHPLDGFTGSPSFLLAYATDASATDGIKAPADYTNAGVKQGQAISVSIANLLDTAKTADGSLSGPDADGFYTATLLGTGTKKFPVGASMRAVALQGYFTQVSPAAARHTISVVKEVTGDAVRRKVVDPEKCSNCHEWFEGHGGNRVYQTQVCVMCHVPGLATSGRGIADSTISTWPFVGEALKIVNFWGFDKTKPNAALALPVTTNNFKDMIHGIHAGRDRVNPFRDARDRTPSTIQLLDFARMDFPGRLNNCETCHVAGTYSSVPLNALPATYESVDAAYDSAIAAGTATPALAKAALSTNNGTDRVTTPFAGACVSCHDSAATKSHIKLQGGQIQANRSTVAQVATESCVTCHGPGKGEDPAVAHKR